MAFTNIDLVKKHLREQPLAGPAIENEPVIMTGTTPAQLSHTNLVPGSEKIKAIEQNEPTLEMVTISQSWVALTHPELLGDSVLLAKDSSLSVIYIENVDYSVDYDLGRVRLIPTGAISEGQSVAIWYQYYRVYLKNSDYQIDYSRGQIWRLATGVIEDSQRVFCDYQLDLATLGDEVIANAVLESEERTNKFIDPAYLFSQDQSLVTGATYWAVAVLCNIKALAAMEAPGPSGVQARALSRSWAVMSNVYNRRGLELLLPFARQASYLNSPIAVSGSQC